MAMSNPVEPSHIVDALKWRYATKAFDPSRKIPAETWEKLEESLILTPSSFGLQPWQFLVIDDPALREQLLPHAWNQRQVVDASHLVVFAVPRSVDDSVVDRFLQATADSRGIDVSELDGFRKMMVGFVVQGMDAGQQKDWAVRQSYIALGQFMLAAAMLEIDTCPMEGFIPAEFDSILGLEEQDLTTAVLCPAGYRSGEDKYAIFPKVRYDKSELVRHI